MTLKVRNRIMQLFMVFSLICILTATICFIIALINKAITPPPTLRFPAILDKVFILKYSFIATTIGIILTVFYAPVVTYHVQKFFEATPATETIFFMAFMIACLAEGVRFLTPLFGLWSTFSDFLFFCGRVLFMGRIIAPLSFVFAAICSSAEQRQNVERNLMLLFALAVVFAVIVPLNTAKISSAGTVTWGFPKLFLISRLLFTAIAFISFWVNGKNEDIKEYKLMGIYMLVMLAGYSLMVTADNYAFVIAGYPLMIFGTIQYLKNLHQANS